MRKRRRECWSFHFLQGMPWKTPCRETHWWMLAQFSVSHRVEVKCCLLLSCYFWLNNFFVCSSWREIFYMTKLFFHFFSHFFRAVHAGRYATRQDHCPLTETWAWMSAGKHSWFKYPTSRNNKKLFALLSQVQPRLEVDKFSVCRDRGPWLKRFRNVSGYSERLISHLSFLHCLTYRRLHKSERRYVRASIRNVHGPEISGPAPPENYFLRPGPPGPWIFAGSYERGTSCGIAYPPIRGFVRKCEHKANGAWTLGMWICKKKRPTYIHHEQFNAFRNSFGFRTQPLTLHALC